MCCNALTVEFRLIKGLTFGRKRHCNRHCKLHCNVTVTLKHLMYCKHYKGGLKAALSSTVKLVSSTDPLPACGYFAAKMSAGI